MIFDISIGVMLEIDFQISGTFSEQNRKSKLSAQAKIDSQPGLLVGLDLLPRPRLACNQGCSPDLISPTGWLTEYKKSEALHAFFYFLTAFFCKQKRQSGNKKVLLCRTSLFGIYVPRTRAQNDIFTTLCKRLIISVCEIVMY